MNKAKLKAYAPAARRDFIQAVTQRANLLGLTAADIAPVQITGDIALINGRPWPAKVAQQRELLVARIKGQGFAAVMEVEAYGWFNRFAALRYMELHDYLGHGYRVLSSQMGVLPEILESATSLDSSSLLGLDRDEVVRLKLAGDKDNELYRLLLTTQCNALAKNMGFLFETLGDETELLLPDNLLNSDSVIAKLLAEIPEEDWAEVEIIGWLYQFYISEKKEQVIGKVVKSEDIPAATQLFTPNWIVQYLVQNSVGRLWLMANPQSTLAQEWPYYITPAAQTPDVDEALNSLILTRIREDGDTLNPESITVLDPACGSGHILVVAYDVLKAIYLERGYQPRTIPRLILEKNLYGLDIDDRAAQMAGFALLMKARADDRRLFTATDVAGNLQPTKLNVLSLQESRGLRVDELATHLAPFKVQRATITALVETFEHAKSFGSLIQIPDSLKTHLVELPEMLALAKQSGDMYTKAAADDLLPLVQQAKLLAMQFDAVVANPPYLASKGMNKSVKEFVETNLETGKGDLFAAFVIRCTTALHGPGILAFMTPFTWMFLSSYLPLRKYILDNIRLVSLVQPEYHAIMDSAAVPICAFVSQRHIPQHAKAAFFDLTTFFGAEDQSQALREQATSSSGKFRYDVDISEFSAIPRYPFAYSLSEKVRQAYGRSMILGNYCSPRQGIKTGENERFIRFWHEVSHEKISIPNSRGDTASYKWYLCSKGGAFRRWYGNNDYILNWENDGREIRNFKDENGKIRSRPQNVDWFFNEGATWSTITSSHLSMRYFPKGFVFESKGSVCFPVKKFTPFSLLAFMNSVVIGKIISTISPTIDYSEGSLASLPVVDFDIEIADSLGSECVSIAKADWDSFETSWAFTKFWGHPQSFEQSLDNSWNAWSKIQKDRFLNLRNLELQINQLFVSAYDLQNEMSPHVSEDQTTLTHADRENDCQRLISYAIGCMMGRYCLDEPGLVYAHAGNADFDATCYKKFPADADGIVPVTDEFWFDDDAANRVREFLGAVWGAETLAENMNWLADSLGRKAGQNAEEAIRRYIAGSFFKDHLKTYKKRPIYWLFSSGKQKAFECLVYLHRYNEGTLARMRNEYVIPLAGKFGGRADLLQNQIDSASTTSERTKLQKELDTLKKKQLELNQFDEQLRHYADQRISIDLDDGVKVNYGKFGNLLAEVKAITGGAGDD